MDLFNALVTPVMAQVNYENVSNPVAITNLTTLFNWALNLILAVGFSLVVIMLALGFVRFIMSQGDKTATEQAQKWVTYAAIGGVGLFLVFAVKSVLSNLFGGNANNLNTGTGTQIGG
jgi:putative copper export protein